MQYSLRSCQHTHCVVSADHTDEPFAVHSLRFDMSDTDILGIILGAVALLMFVVGILLVI
ncbi:hypothetical protein [Haloferax sp. DFSO52]|uniref:hypothetical protein n=1 Tax=Haloferax sp. DFSO52 TaxID=3388505 RepID=UPI003A899E04